MHCTQLEILHKMVSILFLYGDNVIVAMVTRRVKTDIYEYCYAARSTFAKIKVVVTCTYSNFFAQGLQTRSSNVLWKTADHHGTIECMIEFA